jgi:hypothetical protein
MFASRSWKGETPASVTEVIRVDSDILKVMGRIMATSKDDEKVALLAMDDWNVRTLSAYLGQPGPKATEHQWPDPASTNWLQRVNFVLCQGTWAPLTSTGWRSTRRRASRPATPS